VLIYRPEKPLDGWPLQIADERFGFAWYCGAGMIVTQAAVAHGTEAAAHAYHDLADRVLSRCTSDVEAAGGLYVIHDMRLLESYESTARRAWAERMSRRARGYLRGSTVVVDRASPLLKMAVSGINLLAALKLGSAIEIAKDMSEALRAHSVQRPAEDARFP
jgi:hypothetical protein